MQHFAFNVRPDRAIEIGLWFSSAFEGDLKICDGDRVLLHTHLTLQPGQAWQKRRTGFEGDRISTLSWSCVHQGQLVLAYRPLDRDRVADRSRQIATEPPRPDQVSSVDELFHIRSHLEQYRHPTRSPEPYWQEGLRRDSGELSLPSGTRKNVACSVDCTNWLESICSRL